MSTSTVYTIPDAQNLDGLNLHTKKFRYVFEHRLDDGRLKREENVLLSTYPRTGSTWLGQIVSLMLAGEDQYEECKKIRQDVRTRLLEMTYIGEQQAQIETFHEMPVPRALKTHLPYRFIRRWIDEDNVRTLITTRNPKDTLVSIFHFYQNMEGYAFSDDWNDFFAHVMAEKQIYGVQLHWLQDWDANKHKGPVMFIKYEDMKQDIVAQVRRIAQFLELTITDSFMAKLTSNAHLKSMQSDPAASAQRNAKPNAKFIRRGKIGEWKEYFTVEQNEWFDKKYKKLYEELDIDVDYE